MSGEVEWAYWYFLILKCNIKIIYGKEINIKHGTSPYNSVLLKDAKSYFFYSLLKHLLE